MSKEKAVQLLGMMQGGYNVATLIELLDNKELSALAADQLKHTLLVFEGFNDVKDKAAAKGNANAKAVLES